MTLSSRMPDLDSFEVFLAVAETGSLGGAARELGLTQQAVSRRLALMEARAGIPLATRTTRGTELTAGGQFVFDCAQRLLEVARDIDANLGALRQQHQTQIRVVASPTVAEFLVPLWMLSMKLTEAHETHPPPKVVLAASSSSEVIASIREGRADLGFVENPGAPVGLGHCVVGEDELVVVVPPGHLWVRRSNSICAEELSETPLISREAGVGIRDSLTVALRRVLGDDMNQAAPLLELPSMGAMRAAVLAGAGPAVMSRLSVSDDLAAGRLHEIPVPGLDLRRQFRAVWQGGRTPPAGAVRRLLSHIGNYAAAQSR
ncbi:LysR family transcriptional regulator [Candidatus Mycobacterium wuenschmannii]|uniref:LysR family transcriptional regulator n=1 Tax=Candidatus Mycobacterium wuenschmannii TaxID=3027808 RepID=A0ABY8W143_9MYCO|nr:LysR family transcriptional regulator [Candidatus Mycobacterium wuenschmannii]WIM89610.1 LysR family transcriptional regulator [Candidatus Mycobacterium wuenschmannii]